MTIKTNFLVLFSTFFQEWNVQQWRREQKIGETKIDLKII